MVIGSYIEAVCGINNIKISGSQQLATDIGYGRDAGDEGRYLSNVISAFGLGNASVLGVFKEVFALTDSGSKRKAVMKTRAVAEAEHRGNHFRRRGPHPPESGETARSTGVLMCFLEQTSDILIHNSENSSPQTAYQMELAEEAILGHRSAASLATGPVIPDPFISPLGFTITPALSIPHAIPQRLPSKYRNTPFLRLQLFLCLTTIAGMTRTSMGTNEEYPSCGARAYPSSRRP